MYINVGSIGRCNDSQIYEKSQLKKNLTESNLLQQMAKTISGVQVPVFIIGDSAFRLSKHIMKPYPFNVENSEVKKAYNYALSKCRRTVENAFGHLKARFRRIGKGIDNTMKHVPLIIKTCCVLHNFLNDNNDKMNEKWIEELRQTQNRPQYAEETIWNEEDDNGEQIRHALAVHIGKKIDLNF